MVNAPMHRRYFALWHSALRHAVQASCHIRTQVHPPYLMATHTSPVR
jgi:hypothetical protein